MLVLACIAANERRMFLRLVLSGLCRLSGSFVAPSSLSRSLVPMRRASRCTTSTDLLYSHLQATIGRLSAPAPAPAAAGAVSAVSATVEKLDIPGGMVRRLFGRHDPYAF